MGTPVQHSASQTDEELTILIRQSDLAAFKIIYYRYYEKLSRFVWLKTNNPDFEDVVQEVFSRLWESRKKLVNIKSFQAYIYRITNNLIIDYYRKKSHRFDHLTTTPEKPVQSNEENWDKHIDLESAIANLPDKVREVFILSRFQVLK